MFSSPGKCIHLPLIFIRLRCQLLVSWHPAAPRYVSSNSNIGTQTSKVADCEAISPASIASQSSVSLNSTETSPVARVQLHRYEATSIQSTRENGHDLHTNSTYSNVTIVKCSDHVQLRRLWRHRSFLFRNSQLRSSTSLNHLRLFDILAQHGIKSRRVSDALHA